MLSPGARLNGRFLIEALVAGGGMGSVYRAIDLVSGETVAVKTLAGDHSPQRFSRESSVLASLRHPAVVRYVAHGTSEAGVPFLVMEWLRGEDLAQRLRHTGLTVAESLKLIRRACEGLALAHAHGIVHRDIKPSNLFITHDDPAAVKIVDFGVARRRLAGETLTRAGGMLGTVGYMAPEQAMGASDVDPRADVFALGCVLFECLTGRPAFVGQHDVAVLAKVLREDPPLISELRPGLGDALDELVKLMLSKDRAARPADAEALLTLLDALGEPSGGRPPVQPELAQRLTGSEQRIVSVILGRPRGTAAQTVSLEQGELDSRRLQALSVRFAADPVPLAGGGLLFLMSSQDAATDLAQRAARCSLALQRLRRDLALAVATGSVDVSARIPVGMAIDRAAAALDERDNDEPFVALDETTSGLLGDCFELRRTKGRSLLVGEHEYGESPRLLMGVPTQTVGREKELALLVATLHECVDDSVARAVLITGAPGIGKSRLAREFCARVREENTARLLSGRAEPMAAGGALSLLQRLVRAAVGLREAEADAEQKLAAYVAALVPEDTAPWLAEFLSELIGLSSKSPSPLLRAARNDPEVMREQNRRAVLRWIEAELGQRPLVILAEDLHWADLPSWSSLESLRQELVHRPFLLVATARPEVHDLFPRLRQSQGLQEIRLAGLTRRAAERLASSVLPTSVGSDVLERIIGLADGNAFYLEELIRRVAEGGTELPETVLAMAQSRLQLLSPEARRLLRAASVFGETFWVSGVRALLGEGADEDYWLDFLTTREIVVRRHDSRFPQEREYAFRHALLRDAAYGMLTSEDHKVAHRLAGEWLESIGEREALVLADHFERGELPERALPWVVRAAQAALDAGDFSAASALARRGLGLQPSAAHQGVLLLIEAYVSAWGMRPDLRALAEALALLPKSSASWWLSLSLLIFGSAAVGKPEDAQPYLQLALETPPGPELTGMYGAAMQALAAGMVLMGRAESAWPLIDRFEHISPEDPACDLLFVAWLNLARCQLAVTCPVRGAWQLERALNWGKGAEAAMRQAGSRSGHVTALFYLGNASRIVGLYEQAERALRSCADLAARSGNTLMRQYSQLILSLVLLRRNHVTEARELLASLLASPDPNVAHGAEAVMAEAHFREHDFSAALGVAQRAAIGPASPYRRMGHSTLARTHLALENAESALASAERALSEGAAANPEFEADLLATRAEALLAVGRDAEARDTLLRAESFVFSVAEHIEAPALRECFLRELSGNARVLELARRVRRSAG